MITYKLNHDGKWALLFVDGVSTKEWHNTETNEAYLTWLKKGNQPLPADEGTPPA